MPDVTYKQEQALPAFNGVELAGMWTLTFADSVVPDEGDAFSGFQLYGTTSVAPVPASLPILLVGVGCLVAWRRRSTS